MSDSSSRHQEFKALFAIYYYNEGEPNRFDATFEKVAAFTGVKRSTVLQASDYLHSGGMIQRKSRRGPFALTSSGKNSIESSVQNPGSANGLFPAVNAVDPNIVGYYRELGRQVKEIRNQIRVPKSRVMDYFLILLPMYVLIGLAAGFLYETIHRPPFEWLYFFVPALFVSCIATWSHFSRLDVVSFDHYYGSGLRNFLTYFQPPVTAILFAFGSLGYVDLVNALTGRQPEVVSGKIVKLESASILYSVLADENVYKVVFEDDRTKERLSLTVPASSYHFLKIGGRYQRNMRRGGLGMLYR